MSEKYRVIPFSTAEANYDALKSGRCRVMMELYLNSDEWRQLAEESQTSQFADACILAAKECEKVDGRSKVEEPLVTYPTGAVMLQEGWYSQADIENILLGMKQANKDVLRSMEKVPKEKKK